uniref:Uncharacterized protein n=1 Tax=Chromera velia CCMP2878 TaxID=1169474 RepID=A0A0G4HMG0_9ALVE|eukprot:Cvel_29098.t1-p1 / transcript=Cvel_29098.t1 / gene=Cvel_29098 / organism=Chromera_velia_CCMP2878 / gene_product=hypothetical protein / transcript_product=hypothetical protein / location=Cvel_scaffold3927:9010-9228(-) / protein_length=73 / sequence_SO=supercontig / SO=protein_coding / is_pseudo=false
MQKAKEIFAEFPDLQIVEGTHLLGGHVGTPDAYREKWVQEKDLVKERAKNVERVATAAESAPHEAYAAYSKSL